MSNQHVRTLWIKNKHSSYRQGSGDEDPLLDTEDPHVVHSRERVEIHCLKGKLRHLVASRRPTHSDNKK